MTVAEYLARCMVESDQEWATAEVENIPTHTWKRDNSSIVIDSIEIQPSRWESDDDVLVLTIHGHDTQSPQAPFRENWEVRPSLTKGLKAECTEDSIAGMWITECLLDALGSTKR